MWLSTTAAIILGSVAHGLHVHPGRQHLVYPVGSMIVIEDINTRKQDLLAGHSNTISCIDVARNGSLIASGQITFMGFKVIY
jgi:cilia- and flagella-associated protein 52